MLLWYATGQAQAKAFFRILSIGFRLNRFITLVNAVRNSPFKLIIWDLISHQSLFLTWMNLLGIYWRALPWPWGREYYKQYAGAICSKEIWTTYRRRREPEIKWRAELQWNKTSLRRPGRNILVCNAWSSEANFLERKWNLTWDIWIFSTLHLCLYYWSNYPTAICR